MYIALHMLLMTIFQADLEGMSEAKLPILCLYTVFKFHILLSY